LQNWRFSREVLKRFIVNVVEYRHYRFYKRVSISSRYATIDEVLGLQPVRVRTNHEIVQTFVEFIVDVDVCVSVPLADKHIKPSASDLSMIFQPTNRRGTRNPVSVVIESADHSVRVIREMQLDSRALECRAQVRINQFRDSALVFVPHRIDSLIVKTTENIITATSSITCLAHD
jgi:hypothetical protein